MCETGIAIAQHIIIDLKQLRPGAFRRKLRCCQIWQETNLPYLLIFGPPHVA
ncbi:hypothetical protein [Thalassospira profundimaris]|uniref:hypothetical protein n=1 Tax=Thalassospira profundimaris TaxID=502049 RepID=UPI0015F074BD|nr:hypothetical protein [Thalassospira profundimaris]